jgi:hypothetical protein
MGWDGWPTSDLTDTIGCPIFDAKRLRWVGPFERSSNPKPLPPAPSSLQDSAASATLPADASLRAPTCLPDSRYVQVCCEDCLAGPFAIAQSANLLRCQAQDSASPLQSLVKPPTRAKAIAKTPYLTPSKSLPDQKIKCRKVRIFRVRFSTIEIDR